MNKTIKTLAIIGLFSLGIFFGGSEKANAATATCLTLHAGFCEAAGLNFGLNSEIDFEKVKTALKKHYDDHSAIFGWSYMKYRGGHWYWVCVNEDIIRFSGVPAPCTPRWGTYGPCDVECGGGLQWSTQTCTGNRRNQSCNEQPCCGLADRESYERTSEVITAGRCDVGDTVSSWVDNSGLAAHDGLAWTWNCNDGHADSNQCLAYKKGECEYDAVNNPNTPPYDTRDDACRFGALNSARLFGGILYWQCGTGDSDKTVGNFFFNNPGDGLAVTVDYYGPKAGGVECQCIPVYEYDCVGLGTYTGSCTNNCGGTIEEDSQAVKRDTNCFTNESLFITKAEYNTATGRHCSNNVVQCAPCGTQDSEGGNYHETN